MYIFMCTVCMYVRSCLSSSSKSALIKLKSCKGKTSYLDVDIRNNLHLHFAACRVRLLVLRVPPLERRRVVALSSKLNS